MCVFETIAFAASRAEICLAFVSSRTVRIEPFHLPIANKWMVATNHESQSARKFSRFFGVVEVPLVTRHGQPLWVQLTNPLRYKREGKITSMR